MPMLPADAKQPKARGRGRSHSMLVPWSAISVLRRKGYNHMMNMWMANGYKLSTLEQVQEET